MKLLLALTIAACGHGGSTCPRPLTSTTLASQQPQCPVVSR